jgi:adenylyltransferase/sulfurtransferase
MPEPIIWDEDSRFARFSLIGWWDQERLRAAKILVVGAGALGNEIVKDLALFGVGHLALVDTDRVERSNLTRSCLFREADIGRPKVEVLCREARGLYDGLEAVGLEASIVHQVGLGWFHWADLVLAGLDNREARLAISRACQLTSRPWVDGGIDVLAGVVRTFLPGDGPCYECTLSEADWAILDQRRACSLLPREERPREPRVPTTPTTAAIVAGMQCNEALKLLHGLDGMRGAGLQWEGRSCDSYLVRYRRDPDCCGHERFHEVIALELSCRTLLGEALERIRSAVGPSVKIEAPRELVGGLRCGICGLERPVRAALDALHAELALCPACGRPCIPLLYHALDSAPADLSLAELGIPPLDVLRVHQGDRLLGVLLAQDRDTWFHRVGVNG